MTGTTGTTDSVDSEVFPPLSEAGGGVWVLGGLPTTVEAAPEFVWTAVDLLTGTIGTTDCVDS